MVLVGVLECINGCGITWREGARRGEGAEAAT